MSEYLTKQDVIDLITPLTDVIPPEFFYAMGQRESNLNPECVTPEENGTTSIGVWQVNAEEQKSASVIGDLKDAAVNASVIVYKMTQNLYALANKYGFDASNPPPDAWYYLAASHNAGLGRVEGWIDGQSSVLDWAQTVENHPTFPTIAKGYAQYIGDAARDAQAPGGSAPDSGGTGMDIVLVLLIVGAALLMAVA